MRFLLLVFSALVFTQTSFASEYIIKFKSGLSEKKMQAFMTMNTPLKSTIPQLNMAVVDGNGKDAEVLKKNLSDDIEYIAKNGSVHALGAPKDKWSGEADALWAMDAIKLKEAWLVTKGSKDIVVAVSDSGTMLNHFELKDNLWHNPGETGLDASGKDKSKNGIDDDGNGYIDDVYGYNFETNIASPQENHYHGTHVAGTVAAVGGNGGIVGVAGTTSLMTVKFLTALGSGTDDAAIKTIIYAADNGARVINCSWGSDEFSQPLYDAIAYAREKGVIVVAAAGNDGVNSDKTPMYPADYDLDNIVTVAATSDPNGSLAGFSNYGKISVDIAAPGDHIYSSFNMFYKTMYCGNSLTNFYCYLSGTSMAAPHVTGALALIYSANPKLNYKEAKEILLSTAAPSKYLKDKVLSGGQLDVAAAVKKASAQK